VGESRITNHHTSKPLLIFLHDSRSKESPAKPHAQRLDRTQPPHARAVSPLLKTSLPSAHATLPEVTDWSRVFASFSLMPCAGKSSLMSTGDIVVQWAIQRVGC